MKEWKTKLRRAYAVGLSAQEKGIIPATEAALNTYVDELVSFGDAEFESTKRLIAKVDGRKGGSLPRVGTDGVAQAMTVTASAESAPETSINDKLSMLNWK